MDDTAFAAPPPSLGCLIARELAGLSPLALMRHARTTIVAVRRCDDPVALSGAIDHAGDIDRSLRDHGVAVADRNAAAELKLWSMCRLGSWLIGANMRGGNRRSPAPCGMTLAGLAISANQSSQCRRLGAVGQDALSRVIDRFTAAGRPIQLTGVLKGLGCGGADGEASTQAATGFGTPSISTAGLDNRWSPENLLGHLGMLEQLLEPLLQRVRASKAKRCRAYGDRDRLDEAMLDADAIEMYLGAAREEAQNLTGHQPGVK